MSRTHIMLSYFITVTILDTIVTYREEKLLLFNVLFMCKPVIVCLSRITKHLH